MASILLATAVAATAGSIYSSNQAAKQQKKANALQRKQSELSAQRARIDEIRKGRLAHAAAAVNAVGQGVDYSSGAAGGQGSIISQSLSNLSFLDQSNRISDQASEALGKAIKYGNYAQMFGGVANLSLTLMGARLGGKGTPNKAPTHSGPNIGLSSPQPGNNFR